MRVHAVARDCGLDAVRAVMWCATPIMKIDKARPLVHWVRLLPRHARLREGTREASRGGGVLPMYPVCTRELPNGR